MSEAGISSATPDPDKEPARANNTAPKPLKPVAKSADLAPLASPPAPQEAPVAKTMAPLDAAAPPDTGMETEEESHYKKKKITDPQFDAWAAAERQRFLKMLETEKDETNQAKIKKALEDQAEATERLRDYLKQGKALSLSKDRKILYIASEEDSRKWLALKMIVDPDTQQETEFIGVNRSLMSNKQLTEKDAMAIMDMAQFKGWASVKLHGNQEEKSLLWLAAQRHGLAVQMNGFMPSKEHIAHWEKEQALKAAQAASRAPVGISHAPESKPEATTAKPKEPKTDAPIGNAVKTPIYKSPASFTRAVSGAPYKAASDFKKAAERPTAKTPVKAVERPKLPVKQSSFKV